MESLRTGKRKSRFHAWLDSVLNMKNKNNLETFELGNKPKLREEAIDRENTLMNVLKSVKSKQSKEDLAAGTEAASTTSTKGLEVCSLCTQSEGFFGVNFKTLCFLRLFVLWYAKQIQRERFDNSPHQATDSG